MEVLRFLNTCISHTLHTYKIPHGFTVSPLISGLVTGEQITECKRDLCAPPGCYFMQQTLRGAWRQTTEHRSRRKTIVTNSRKKISPDNRKKSHL
jgi:hypothetical protein